MTHTIKIPPLGEIRIRRNGDLIDLAIVLPLFGQKTASLTLAQASVLASALQIEIEAA